MTSYHQLEGFGKGQKGEETQVNMSYQPPRILLTRIHLGWVMCAAPERTLNQKQLELFGQTQLGNLLHYHKTWDWEPRGRRVLGSLTLLFSAWVSLANKISHFVSMCSPQTIHFWVLDKSLLSGPERVPILATGVLIRETGFIILVRLLGESVDII